MPWLMLLLSSVLEAVWANALGASDGLTKFWPSVIFVAGLVPGMLMLAYVVRHIPMSTAYACWAGLGAVFTVAWAMIAGTETVSVLKILFLTGIVVGVVGLKLVGSSSSTPAAPQASPETASDPAAG